MIPKELSWPNPNLINENNTMKNFQATQGRKSAVSITLRLLSAIMISLIAISGSANANDKPLKIFLLVGQSNMQGHAHVRTLEHVGMDPKSRYLLDAIQDQNGKPRGVTPKPSLRSVTRRSLNITCWKCFPILRATCIWVMCATTPWAT